MKKILGIILMMVIACFCLVSCESEDDAGNGTLTLSITDAPTDDTTIAGVYLKITEIQYHLNDKEWEKFEEYVEPQTFNILELVNGNSALLGSFELSAGKYTQLRFILDAPEYGGGNHTNPGCYVEFNDGSMEALFVPSGSESGWKAVGNFTVPSNGNVEVTADFDARKSIVKRTGSDKYILRPTIRLIVDNQAGKIAGAITNIPEGIEIIIFAYEDGVYAESEANEPVDSTQSRFPNSITSSIADESNNYQLAYLAPMTYDLVVTSSVNGEYQEVLGVIEDILVESKKTTNQPIDISSI